MQLLVESKEKANVVMPLYGRPRKLGDGKSCPYCGSVALQTKEGKRGNGRQRMK
eukprot:g64068.t1